MVGCGMTFATNLSLSEHIKTQHPVDEAPSEVVGTEDDTGALAGESSRKRKIDEVTPLIEPMPSEMAKRNRAVFSGPSRTFQVGQKRN